jgi:hypothetical protein
VSLRISPDVVVRLNVLEVVARLVSASVLVVFLLELLSLERVGVGAGFGVYRVGVITTMLDGLSGGFATCPTPSGGPSLAAVLPAALQQLVKT